MYDTNSYWKCEMGGTSQVIKHRMGKKRLILASLQMWFQWSEHILITIDVIHLLHQHVCGQVQSDCDVIPENVLFTLK